MLQTTAIVMCYGTTVRAKTTFSEDPPYLAAALSALSDRQYHPIS
jgi:hypothetical protein